uniref:Uncharacterized protein n=1 Tax=Meloidogyne hapla TaxID=6305 RepID=A0A1I8B822_MELHA
MVDAEEEQIKLKELEEEMDAEVEISKVVEFMVENVVNENGSGENTSFSSSESLVENDVNEEAKEEYINKDIPINEDTPLTFIEPEENLPTKLTKDGNTPFTSTESLLEKDNANEDGETTPYASIESLVEKVENEESIN